MFSLLGRLAISLVLLMGFSVFAAWAWDRSDQIHGGSAVRAQQSQSQSISVSSNADDSQS